MSDVPAQVYYAGAYDDTAAYAPGAIIVASSHIYICTDYVAANAGHNTAPASDTAHFDLLL